MNKIILLRMGCKELLLRRKVESVKTGMGFFYGQMHSFGLETRMMVKNDQYWAFFKESNF